MRSLLHISCPHGGSTHLQQGSQICRWIRARAHARPKVKARVGEGTGVASITYQQLCSRAWVSYSQPHPASSGCEGGQLRTHRHLQHGTCIHPHLRIYLIHSTSDWLIDWLRTDRRLRLTSSSSNRSKMMIMMTMRVRITIRCNRTKWSIVSFVNSSPLFSTLTYRQEESGYKHIYISHDKPQSSRRNFITTWYNHNTNYKISQMVIIIIIIVITDRRLMRITDRQAGKQASKQTK